jgi:hypothetical protein
MMSAALADVKRFPFRALGPVKVQGLHGSYLKSCL